MTTSRDHDTLAETFAGLAPEQASEDFTRRVLDALDQRRALGRPGLSPRWTVTFATLATSGLVLGFWLGTRATDEPASPADRVSLLRQEYESLQSEVELLRALAAQPPPVVYLGGDSRIDVVLDLGQDTLEAATPDGRSMVVSTRRVEP
jgi:hypothetical protein